MSTELQMLSHLTLRQAFEWWDSGDRLSERASENEWLGVIQVLTMPFVRQLSEWDSDDKQRLFGVEISWYFDILDEVFDYVESRQIMDHNYVLVQRLGLCHVLVRDGVVVDSSSPFSPDRLVRTVFREIAEDRVAEAERLGPVWRTLERPVVLRLMHLKHLIHLALGLRDQLADPEDAATVDGWHAVYSLLPTAGKSAETWLT